METAKLFAVKSGGKSKYGSMATSLLEAVGSPTMSISYVLMMLAGQGELRIGIRPAVTHPCLPSLFRV